MVVLVDSMLCHSTMSNHGMQRGGYIYICTYIHFVTNAQITAIFAVVRPRPRRLPMSAYVRLATVQSERDRADLRADDREVAPRQQSRRVSNRVTMCKHVHVCTHVEDSRLADAWHGDLVEELCDQHLAAGSVCHVRQANGRLGTTSRAGMRARHQFIGAEQQCEPLAMLGQQPQQPAKELVPSHPVQLPHHLDVCNQPLLGNLDGCWHPAKPARC